MNHKVLVNMEKLHSESTSQTTLQTIQEKLRHRRMDTTDRPSYSMARAIQTTTWQKLLVTLTY